MAMIRLVHPGSAISLRRLTGIFSPSCRIRVLSCNRGKSLKCLPQDASIKVEVQERIGPTAHPCVSENGFLMLGTLRDVFIRYLGTKQYATALKLLTDLLSSVPKTEGLRKRLQLWPAVV